MPRVAVQVVEALVRTGATVATAESLTGGELASRLVSVPGASVAFRGGIVAYATDLKASILGVDEALLTARGAVDAEVAQAMAAGVQTITQAMYAVATTGVAGPDDQGGKSPGTVFIGLRGPFGQDVIPLELHGDRQSIRDQTVEHALVALLELVTSQ